ncbi:hypothetical protein C6353_24935 [Bacillus toyonensis]|nr:hypothetical protein C6353_24935 [Bacillus toyonensis]
MASAFYFRSGNVFNRGSVHHNQAKKSKYPQTRELASQGEKVQFFILGCYKIFKLMDMGSPYQKKKIVRLDTF